MENEEALRRYKEKLELISYYRSPLYEFQDFLRLSVILRKLLLTGETHPAKLEELAESLFVSHSAFRRDMKKCSRFLGSYSLNLHSKPGQGTYVEGQERDVRMAMLAIYGFSLKELGMDYVEEPFFEQFSGEDFHEVPITFNLYERHHAAFWKENWQKKPFSVEDQMAADPLYYLTNEVYAPLDAEIALVGTHCGFVDEELFHFSSYTLVRNKDLAAITSQTFKDWIAAHNCELISFRDLK